MRWSQLAKYFLVVGLHSSTNVKDLWIYVEASKKPKKVQQSSAVNTLHILNCEELMTFYPRTFTFTRKCWPLISVSPSNRNWKLPYFKSNKTLFVQAISGITKGQETTFLSVPHTAMLKSWRYWNVTDSYWIKFSNHLKCISNFNMMRGAKSEPLCHQNINIHLSLNHL